MNKEIIIKYAYELVSSVSRIMEKDIVKEA